METFAYLGIAYLAVTMATGYFMQNPPDEWKPAGWVPSGPIYGLMLTAWGAASAFGPLLIAHLRQISESYTSGLHVIAGIMAVSIVLPILVSPPKALTIKSVGSRSAVPVIGSK